MKKLLPLILLTLPAISLAGEPAVNKWTKLSATFPNGYNYSPIVYAADRGQLLHWGAMRHARGGIKPGNDVRAFDAGALKWVSDYPSDPGQNWGYTGGGSGRAISYVGKGTMLKSGRPFAAHVVNAVCYDPKRKQVIYSMPGLMAAYDPATKKWKDLKATTELHGKKLPGGPPVYGAGMCYDPVNDEIVMFPQFGAQSADMRVATGRISGHLGTLRYSFKTNTWKRVGAELALGDVKNVRKAIKDLLGKISHALDEIWLARRKGDKAALVAAGKKLEACAAECAKLKLGNEACDGLKAAAGKASSDPAAAMKAGAKALWSLELQLELFLAVEPTIRSVAPMVYDAKNKVIVLFGGDSGRIRTDLDTRAERIAGDRKLNDTWLYDVKTRQWSNASKANRPPALQAPNLVYDPASGLTLLVTVRGHKYDKRVPRKVSIWSFDAARREWALRSEESFDGEITDWYSVGLDTKKKLLVLCQTVAKDQVSWAMKLDVRSMASKPAPAYKALPAEKPTVIPPDDPAWVAKLKSLPANTWTGAKPPREAARRDWGNIACDPVRGLMFFFGGGHSTYQGTDVAVYAVGANKWAHQAGGHNDSVPRVGWGGYHIGARGSSNAGHMRNQYVALDGRMYMNTGFGNQIKPRDGQIFTETEVVSIPDKPHGWFYDLDRGGVWRQLPTAIEGKLPKVHRGSRGGRPLVVDPAGKIYSLVLKNPNRYDKRTTSAAVYCYDIYARKATIKEIPAPWPMRPPESRPYCMLPDRNQIFFQDVDAARKDPKPPRTWVYDIKSNKFIELKPPAQPPGRACGTAYINGQDAVYAAIDVGGRKFQEWVYSLKHNKWVQLPGGSKIGFKAPYAQFDYVAKYGVIVNYNSRTCVMRPDFSKLDFK